MFNVIDIKKQAQGISFNEKLAIERAVQQRNPDVLALREVSAKGKVTYDDDFYLVSLKVYFKGDQALSCLILHILSL